MGQQVKVNKKDRNGTTVSVHYFDSGMIANQMCLKLPNGQYYEIAEDETAGMALEIKVPVRRLEDMDVDELKQLCKNRGINFAPSIKSKAKLITIIKEAF